VKRKFVIVSVDTECDKGAGWYVRYPLSFVGIHQGIGEILQPLLERIGFVGTYLISPEVMENEDSVDLLEDVKKRGAELGTHLHGEFLEPGKHHRVARTDEKAREYSDDVEWVKLKNLTLLFERTFGFPPISYRAGRFSATLRTLIYLERLGYKVDSSFTPFSAVSGENHTRSPIYPYRPSRDDPYTPGEMNIWEVPITILPRHWIAYKLLRNIPLLRLRRLAKKMFGPVWLRPTTTSLWDARWLVERMEKLHPDPVILVMMFHNVELVKGLSPYPARKVLQNLTDILNLLADRGYEPLRLGDVPSLLKAQDPTTS